MARRTQLRLYYRDTAHRAVRNRELRNHSQLLMCFAVLKCAVYPPGARAGRGLASIFRDLGLVAWACGWRLTFSVLSWPVARLSRRVGGVPLAPAASPS